MFVFSEDHAMRHSWSRSCAMAKGCCLGYETFEESAWDRYINQVVWVISIARSIAISCDWLQSLSKLSQSLGLGSRIWEKLTIASSWSLDINDPSRKNTLSFETGHLAALPKWIVTLRVFHVLNYSGLISLLIFFELKMWIAGDLPI